MVKTIEFMKKHWTKGLLVAVLLMSCFVMYEVKNVGYIEFYVADGRSLRDGKVKNLHYRDGEPWDVVAIYREAVANQEGYEVEVEMIGELDILRLGEYPVTYRATHNGVVAEITVTYVVKDVRRPVITLEGGKEYVIQAGEIYMEPGFTATDIYDGDVTDSVIVTGEPSLYEDFVLTYTVTDSNGNTREVQRYVKVQQGTE